VEFHSSDEAGLSYARHPEFVPTAFTISPGVVAPRGRYTSETVTGSYTLGQQRKVSGAVSASWGTSPGSEPFLVYSDGRDTAPATPLGLPNRSIALKLTRLLRF
jgi:hypothetical protein